MEYRGWRIDLIDESKEKCWIGLQEEIGGAIKACTCHRFGGFHGVGVYLNNMIGFRRPKQLQANVEKLRAIVGMRDVVPGCIVAAAVAFYALVLAPRLKEV